jgi:hypothetical protein
MSKSIEKKIFFLVLILLSTVSHAALFAPSGLNAGDKFHFIFVTSGTTDAFSADIGTYNSFVQATAEAAGIGSTIGLTNWHALASTPTVNANDNWAPLFNDPNNVPIYNMGNYIVANSLMDLWASGSINTILYEEDGSPNYGDVWTGTTPNGNPDLYTALGSSTGLSRFGFPYNASQNISAAPLAYTDQFIQKHLYGVSQELIVLANGEAVLSPVPEPGTYALMLWSLALIGTAALRRAKQVQGQACKTTTFPSHFSSARQAE